MKEFSRDIAIVTEVIIVTKTRRGDGKETPIRIITEVLTKNGELIAEYDPCACEYCGLYNCTSDHK